MTEPLKSSGEGMTRNRFLRFLGKLGVLSLIPGASALAGAQQPIAQPSGRTMAKLSVRSPLIKGKRLSQAALTSRLSTQNLENIRDVITGRFFGKAAEQKYLRGYTPLINWQLGSKGSSSGCFFFAAMTDPKKGRPAVDNCSVFTIASSTDKGKVLVEVLASSGGRVREMIGGGIACALELCASDCASYCASQCSDRCSNYCSARCDSGYCGGHCSPKSELSLGEIVSYPGDRFAAELKQILGTTDVGTLQQELMQIICSNEVMNLGLEAFLTEAHKGISARSGG